MRIIPDVIKNILPVYYDKFTWLDSFDAEFARGPLDETLNGTHRGTFKEKLHRNIFAILKGKKNLPIRIY